MAAGRLLSFLADRAVPGIEHLDGTTYRRSVTAGGAAALLELTPEPDEPVVRLRVSWVDGVPDPAGAVLTARGLFDLDADPETIDAALAADPALAPLVAVAPGTRLPGGADGFELAVRAIVGQQVSVAGARTTLGRIVTRLGTPLRDVAGPVTHRFPVPAAVASASREDLGVPGARAEAIRELARRVDAGDLDLSAGADLETARAGLLSIPGVGTWTAGYVAMRALRDPDAFPTGDLGIRHGIAALGLPDDTRSIVARAERWRPWRAYAAMHLWQADVEERVRVSDAARRAGRHAPVRGEPGRGRRSGGT
jgi:AraC family transcriptional regulator of adaptative response / DNA-3-methyladenine glycosylase II